ncbi:uncharacterized protein LOC135301191 [Passer domesticus]|uniref:uncharacterized protein LOC135301191 n=1 Tax=Passer domesticus TaxID=48849 RepID=UPI0030FE09B9
MKAEHPDRDRNGGTSQPTGEPEVAIITESLMYESLRNLHKDIVRRGREAYTTWLLRVWDLMGTGVQLDGGEARNLGPLTQDSGMNQIFVREPGSLSLWERLLMSVRERFVHRERMQEHHHRMRWKTLEEGIQQLREVAVLEVLFGRDGQHNNDPDKVRCTGQMLWSLANLGPSQYTTFIATIDADTNRETVGSVANKLRNYESMINGPMQAHISAVIKEFKEEMREEMRKVNAAPVRVTGPKVRAQHSPARERGYTPRANLWFFLRDHGEDMGRWDGKPTSVLAARVRQLKEGNSNRGSSTKVKVASTSHDQAFRYDLSDPLEGTSKNPSAVGLLRVEEQLVPIATSTVHRRQYRTHRDAVIPIHRMIQWRLTVDYRALNEVTPPLSAAVPDMLELQYELESKTAKCKKETQAFLGAIGFWRMHIPEYSPIVDQAARIEVSKIDLDWHHKGELFLARWAHDASGHQGRDATYKWARDRGVDLTMDSISQVIHDCETCAAIKQAKRVKPL